MAIGKNPQDQVDEFLNMVDKASGKPNNMADWLRQHQSMKRAVKPSPGSNPVIQGKQMHQAVMDELQSNMPWNSQYNGQGRYTPEINFYVYKEEEHAGRVVFGDMEAVAYDKLAAFTETLNRALAVKYPDQYYTTEDIYRVAQSHVSPWGQAEYVGHHDAFKNCGVNFDFWNIIGKLGGFNPNQFNLKSILISDTDERTGRTNKLAMAYCLEMMEQPNHWFNIKDHHNTPDAHRRLARMIKSILEGMQLKVHIHEYQDHRNQESRVDLKLELIGGYDKRKDGLCNPRTKSTPET